MNNYYRYKVASCPVCKQGWVEIVKDRITHKLFFLCSECWTEWESFEEMGIKGTGTRKRYNSVQYPEMDETIGWQHYILKK